MGSLLSSIVVVDGFKLRLDQTKVYRIGIWCLSATHTPLWHKRQTDSRDLNNVSEWSEMFTRGLPSVLV